MLRSDERLTRALELAYAYLNRQERTVSEVRRHLEQKGIAGELIDASVQTLVDQGYLDDSRYAQMFVADKRELEQWGNDRIRLRLQARGIDRDLVQAALLEVSDEDADGELERALGVLRRRFPQPPCDRRERERALGILLRKGYDSELALDALSAYARGD
jgi:regulatory protein